MTDITLIVPAFAETAVTGFIIGFKYLHRNKLYSVELWKRGEHVRCQKEGRPIVWEKLPTKMQRHIHQHIETMKQLQGIEPCALAN